MQGRHASTQACKNGHLLLSSFLGGGLGGWRGTEGHMAMLHVFCTLVSHVSQVNEREAEGETEGEGGGKCACMHVRAHSPLTTPPSASGHRRGALTPTRSPDTDEEPCPSLSC